MNKRIKELVGQSYETRPLAPSKFNEEKFAELIIRECAGLLVKEAESNHDENTPTYDILIQESNWMKKHFGVE